MGFRGMAQDKGVLSGNFQSNFSVFVLDSSIGAFESPQYFSDISSAEAWLFLNYKIKGFDIAARYDLFNNSNLLNPTSSYSGHGLGFWQVKKSIGGLTLTAVLFMTNLEVGLFLEPLKHVCWESTTPFKGYTPDMISTTTFLLKLLPEIKKDHSRTVSARPVKLLKELTANGLWIWGIEATA
jgi:hypothetical protein